MTSHRMTAKINKIENKIKTKRGQKNNRFLHLKTSHDSLFPR